MSLATRMFVASLMLVCGVLAVGACESVPGTTPPSGLPGPAGADAKPIQSGQSVSSSIDSPSFTQKWTFTGEAGQRVLIRLARTSGLFVPILSLFAPAAESPIVSIAADESAATEEGSLLSGERLIDHQLAASGQYTIVVEDSGLDETGAYDLTFLQMGDTLTSSEDPDGGPIASAQPQAGQFNVVGDMDAFTFAGSTGQQVLVRVVVSTESYGEMWYLSRRTVELGVWPESHPFRIYPPGGGPMLTHSESPHPSFPNGSIELPNHFQLPADGQYTLVLSGPQDDQPAYGITTTGKYRLLLLNLGDTLTSPEDPDGGPISSGETRQPQLDDPLDIDIFAFAGSAGQRVLIRLAHELPIYTGFHMELLPPTGPPRSGYTSSFIDYQLDETGEWKIVVPEQVMQIPGPASSSEFYGGYSITFLNLDGTLTSPGDPDGGPIGFGDTRSGSFSDLADMDAFTFTGAARQKVRVVWEWPGMYDHFFVAVYPPGGGERMSTEPGSGIGDSSGVYVLPTAGEYTIVLNGGLGTFPFSYQFTLEQL